MRVARFAAGRVFAAGRFVVARFAAGRVFAARRFFGVFVPAAFCCFAAFMLSTRLGYGLPARRARARAAAFDFAVSFVCVRFGFLRFQGGDVAMRPTVALRAPRPAAAVLALAIASGGGERGRDERAGACGPGRRLLRQRGEDRGLEWLREVFADRAR